MSLTRISNVNLTAEEIVFSKHREKPYRLTPVIVTLYEGLISNIDIKKMIEIGLQLVRFRMTQVSRYDKLELLKLVKTAQKWVCEKYDVSTWPVGICVDIPNASIRSGYILKDLGVTKIYLHMGQIITMTSSVKAKQNMDSKTIFIDDPYTLQIITPGIEITMCGGGVKLICTEVIDPRNIRCMCILPGYIVNNEFVTFRGVKFKRPILLKFDLELLQLAADIKADHLTVFSVRRSKVIREIRKVCQKLNYEPLILSIICEQEGLDNIDEILEVSDGIILAREFLAHQLVNKYSMCALQLQINAKCKKFGKPFFLSGNILEQTLTDGTISCCDLSDITNAVLQGCGFMLRHYSDAVHLIKAMQILDDVCKSVESAERNVDFWRLIDEYRMPIDAAEACVISCALLVKQTRSLVIILPTVSGRTAVELTRMAPYAVIITVSKNEAVARRLQLFRGIYAIYYDKPSLNDWYLEMEARVQFAVKYGIQREILNYGNTYVTLRKSHPTSSFPDSVGVWNVSAAESRKNKVECTYDDDVYVKPTFSLADELHMIN